LVAVNKPPGVNVHDAPGIGISLLRLLREQHGLGGLTPVHRLDKDASGVLLLARSKSAAAKIQAHWEHAEKHYLALCDGLPALDAGLIDAPILENQTGKPERFERALAYFRKQHPAYPLPPLPAPKTSAVHPAGRASQTDWRVRERFKTGPGFSLLEVSPRQGRMHHIRAHLAHLGFPLAVDPLYGRRSVLSPHDAGLGGDAPLLARMPLHAARLSFINFGKKQTVEAPLPDDFSRVLAALQTTTAI
jgi:23S rRNA pseudouridine1911/1915/1917 synthase